MSNVRSKEALTQERLKQILSYDAETGVFTWKVNRQPGNGTRNTVGSIAGTLKARNSSHPYLLIWIDGFLYRAHRLAWFYVYGRWPAEGIDHINGDPLDNRIANLRECTQQQNNGNHKALNPLNTSGYRGVTWKRDKRKWKAYININNRQTHLGYFDSAEQAYEAYCAAAVAHFGEFARLDVTRT